MESEPSRDISWSRNPAGIFRGVGTQQGYFMESEPSRDISWSRNPAGIFRGVGTHGRDIWWSRRLPQSIRVNALNNCYYAISRKYSDLEVLFEIKNCKLLKRKFTRIQYHLFYPENMLEILQIS